MGVKKVERGSMCSEMFVKMSGKRERERERALRRR